MSFHGGLIGVFLAMWFFAHRQGLRLFQVTDFLVPLVPPGLLFGRIGNFINGELFGHPTDLPWGVVRPCIRTQFRDACDYLGLPPTDTLLGPVHASQLYESFFEGLVLTLAIWLFASRPRPMMAVSGLFLLLYGCFRFALEFVRVPDAHIGYLAFDWLTMGQILSLPMILFGALLLGLAYRPGQQRPPVSG